MAIVTGAGRGIGFGIADALCRAEARVVIGELDEEKGQEAAQVPAETLAPKAWQESVDVVLSGAFYCCQAAGRQILAQEDGVIVNVSSIDGFKAVDGGAAPCTAHAGLAMLTRVLGVEWAGRGVRVVGVAPGPLAEDSTPDGAEGPGSPAAYGRLAPLGRSGTAEEIAEAALYLASEEASYVTAETMTVDGGWTAYQLSRG